MLTIDGKEFRNLEEQVLKNQSDIKFIINEQGVLNQFGIKVVGQGADLLDLPSVENYKQSNPQWEYGDTYAIGTVPPYSLYVLTRANTNNPNDYWFNIGQFPIPGPKGDTGDQGPQGIRGEKGEPGIQGKMGIQGVPGAIGPQGLTGAQGVQGPQGPKGDPGNIYKIIAVLDNIGQLPTPSEYTRNNAYIIDNHLYAIVGDETLEWVDFGVFSSVQGPQGPQGIQGPTGPTAGSNPNILINGDFRVNQRGQEFYTATTSKWQYFVDRWRVYNSGNSFNPLTNTITLKNNSTFEQTIEDYKSIAGKTVTLSAKITNITGLVQLFIAKGGVGQISNNNITTSGTYTFTAKIDSNITSLRVGILNPSSSSGDATVSVDYIKLEIGSIATENSPRPYAEELAMCQRYYLKFDQPNSASITNPVFIGTFFSASASGGYALVDLPNAIRSSFSLTIKNVGYKIGNADVGVFSTTSYAAATHNRTKFKMYCGGGSGFTAGNAYPLCIYGDLALEIDAEIY